MSLFGKRERDLSAENEVPLMGSDSAVSELPMSRPETPMIALAQPADDYRTTIDSSIRVKGELLGDEDVTIDGRVEGIVNLTRTLVVGKRGSVEADVRAANVVVHGSVVGNVVAEQKVEILATGHLEGNIKAPKIVIAEGAHFKGNVDMTSSPSMSSEKTATPFELKA